MGGVEGGFGAQTQLVLTLDLLDLTSSVMVAEMELWESFILLNTFN